MLTFLASLSLLQAPAMPYLGGDPSEIPEVEATGGKFKVNGKVVDPIEAMKGAGWTAVRLRVWNQPKAGFCDKAHTLAMAKRIHRAGLRLMIDFHYSDDWADPAKQYKPAAWEKLAFEDLKKAVHDYTFYVIKVLVDQGTPPDVVQPGNEVTNGMLWPDARLNINTDGWDKFMALNRAAIKAIREASGKRQPKIMMHIDQGGRNVVSRYGFDMYFARGGEADILGLSYYPFWHGTLAELKANLDDLARRYRRDVLIAETAYPFLGWNDVSKRYDPDAVPISRFKATPTGQRDYLRELLRVVRGTADGRGVGVMWWAPTWIGEPGRKGGWERYTLFENGSGEALPGFFAFGGG